MNHKKGYAITRVGCPWCSGTLYRTVQLSSLPHQADAVGGAAANQDQQQQQEPQQEHTCSVSYACSSGDACGAPAAIAADPSLCFSGMNRFDDLCAKFFAALDRHTAEGCGYSDEDYNRTHNGGQEPLLKRHRAETAFQELYSSSRGGDAVGAHEGHMQPLECVHAIRCERPPEIMLDYPMMMRSDSNDDDARGGINDNKCSSGGGGAAVRRDWDQAEDMWDADGGGGDFEAFYSRGGRAMYSEDCGYGGQRMPLFYFLDCRTTGATVFVV